MKVKVTIEGEKKENSATSSYSYENIYEQVLDIEPGVTNDVVKDVIKAVNGFGGTK